MDAGRPPPAGRPAPAPLWLEPLPSVEIADPAAHHPDLRVGGDRRAVPHRAHRPPGAARRRAVGSTRRARCRRTSTCCSTAVSARTAPGGATRDDSAAGAARPRGAARGAAARRRPCAAIETSVCLQLTRRGSARPARRQHRPRAGPLPLGARSPGLRHQPPGGPRHRAQRLRSRALGLARADAIGGGCSARSGRPVASPHRRGPRAPAHPALRAELGRGAARPRRHRAPGAARGRRSAGAGSRRPGDPHRRRRRAGGDGRCRHCDCHRSRRRARRPRNLRRACRSASTSGSRRPARALRISHEDFFDLLGQRADLLQAMFATLFGARRAEWELSGALVVRPDAGPAVIVEELT